MKRVGVEVPGRQDSKFGTWDAYPNEYWPAEYMLDRARATSGHIHYGEGAYDEMERDIRDLLGEKPASGSLRPAPRPDAESARSHRRLYLGYGRLDVSHYTGDDRRPRHGLADVSRSGAPSRCTRCPSRASWRVGARRGRSPGTARRSRLRFEARDVYIVLEVTAA